MVSEEKMFEIMDGRHRIMGILYSHLVGLRHRDSLYGLECINTRHEKTCFMYVRKLLDTRCIIV